MTSFKIFLHKKAEKSLYTLPKHVLKLVYDFISDLEDTPVPWKSWDIKKVKGTRSTYRVKLNKHRIIYWINKDTQEIIILKIELRKKVYK